VGYDAACTIRIDGKTGRGTAWLEHKDLVFRGPFRVAIPLKDIRKARAMDGTLMVEFGDRRAELEIGAPAGKWADRISNPPSRLDKLGVKPGTRVTILGLDDEAFVAELEARGAAVSRRAKPGSADAVFYYVPTRAGLDRLADLKSAIVPDGAIWIVRPKGVTTITEAETMAAGKRAGLVDVKVVSFSDALTSEKYVIPVSKRSTASRPSPARRRKPGSPSSRVRS
jgi:hypothetical protein